MPDSWTRWKPRCPTTAAVRRRKSRRCARPCLRPRFPRRTCRRRCIWPSPEKSPSRYRPQIGFQDVGAGRVSSQVDADHRSSRSGRTCQPLRPTRRMRRWTLRSSSAPVTRRHRRPIWEPELCPCRARPLQRRPHNRGAAASRARASWGRSRAFSRRSSNRDSGADVRPRSQRL